MDGAKFERVLRQSRPGDNPELALVARRMKAARAAMSGPIAPLLVQNPALDLLLALFVAESEGKLLCEDRALAATGVAHGSAQRWLMAMLASGLVEHVGEFVALSEDGCRSLITGLTAALDAEAGRVHSPASGITRG